MQKKRIAAAGAAILMIVSGCRNTVPENDRIEAGIVVFDEQDVFISGVMREVFLMVQEKNGGYEDLTLEMQDGGNDQKKQDRQVERFLDLDYDVVCVNFADRTNAADIISRVKERDVPLVVFNNEPAEADMQLYDKTYYIGTDARQGAELQAEIVLDQWKENPRSIDRNGDGVVSYVILEGRRKQQETDILTEYSVKALENGGMALKKAGGGYADSNRIQAEEQMERWLNQEDFEAELVLANSDEMALGALEAIEKCGAEGIQVVGIGGTEDGKAAVDEGRMLGTVVSDRYLYAEALLKVIRAVGKAEALPESLGADGKYVWIPWEKYTG